MSFISKVADRYVASKHTLVSRTEVQQAQGVTISESFSTPELPDYWPESGVAWAMGPVLDQGKSGMCAGFSAAAAVLARLNPHCSTQTGNDYGAYSYKKQLNLNPYWSKYPNGSSFSVFCMVEGLASDYGRATTIRELAQAVHLYGPLVIAIPWHTTMHRPRNGNITVDLDTDHGWHFVCVRGFDPDRDFNTMPRKQRKRTRQRIRKYDLGSENERKLREKIKPQREAAFLIRNSWGEDWGIDGDAWIKASDLDALMGGNDTKKFADSNGYVKGWNQDSFPGGFQQ